MRRAMTAALALVAGLLTLPAAAPAAYPGTNGELAFTSTQDGGVRHIFVANGSSIVDLTGASTKASETQPKFSPDGREILFTRTAAGSANTQLFVMGAGGSGRTQLTHTAQGNGDATWSPSGTQIAFVSERDRGVPNIFIMRSDGTGVRQITHDGATESELAWAPKGGRIAFVRQPAGGGAHQIYSIKTDGTGFTDLSRDPGSSDIEPAWSPDGRQIVYSGAGHPSGSVGGDLWIMNADGSSQTPLDHETNGYSDGSYPAWSPDGTTIAFSANNGSGYLHVWTVPASGGENAELVKNAIPGGNPVDEEVDWQPAPTSNALGTTIRAQVNKQERTATFTFAAPGATAYKCQLQRGNGTSTLKLCGSPKAYTNLAPGTYRFEVIGSGPGGPYRATAYRFTIG